jgi:hypothetical protein
MGDPFLIWVGEQFFVKPHQSQQNLKRDTLLRPAATRDSLAGFANSIRLFTFGYVAAMLQACIALVFCY